ncbi:hypothetical protein D3C81_1636230 [compost metagenome]
MFFLRSSVMVSPFHSTSTRLPFSSASLALQSIGLNSTVMPRRRLASFAISISKPTSSLLVSRKPIGGKLSSRPTMILLAAALPVLAAAGADSFLPHAANSATDETKRSAANFFIGRSSAERGKSVKQSCVPARTRAPAMLQLLLAARL